MKYLYLVIAIIIVFLTGYWCGRHGSAPPTYDYEDKVVRDTLIDTVKFPMPIPKDSVILKYSYIKLPVKDTVFSTNENVVKVDSVYVEVPITQKEYRDTTYNAWVSGFQATLDSIHIFQKTVTVTERVRTPTKRWGLGIQAGIGYNFTNQIRPYIGIGVTYNILTW